MCGKPFKDRGVLAAVQCILLVLSLTACEVSTSARIHAGPTFSLSGSGRLASFRIYGPSLGRKIATPFDEKSLVWRVQPTEGYFKGELVEGLDVEYGETPKAYVQIVPVTGTASPLQKGQVYWFFAETTGAPGASAFFYFDGSNAIDIDVPGLCQSAFVGDVKPLKCGTQEPYSEPQDLESFVRQHRLH
jgi:hypothetical protein